VKLMAVEEQERINFALGLGKVYEKSFGLKMEAFGGFSDAK
jgi:hypothetical protein